MQKNTITSLFQPLIINVFTLHRLEKCATCLVVVLPPLPGEEGEIYDDVLDPNLGVR